MNKYEYRVGWCKNCNQGWLYIVKDKATQMLFIRCDECEIEWDSPEGIDVYGKSIWNREGIIEVPDYKDILTNGWEEYISYEAK